MKLIIGRMLSILVVAGGWLLLGFRTLLDLIGYSTVPDDTKVALGRIDDFIVWLLGLPIWLPWGFALVATALLMFLSWPRPVAGVLPVTSPAEAVQAPPVQPMSLPSPPPVTPPLPLTPHAVERKLKVIDDGLDRLKTATELQKMSEELRADGWLQGKPNAEEMAYPMKVKMFVAAWRNCVEGIDKLCNGNQEYPDVAAALQQSYYSEASENFAKFQKACQQIDLARASGASWQNLAFVVTPFVEGFAESASALIKWKDKAHGNLIDIRNSISAA